MEHIKVKCCRKHDRFTIKTKKDKKYRNWVGNFNRASKLMLVKFEHDIITHRHPTRMETYQVIESKCDLCMKEE